MMASLPFNILLLALTTAACVTLYLAIWNPRVPLADRLLSEPEAKRRLSGGFSYVVGQAVEKWPGAQPARNPAARQLADRLIHAGFHSARAVAGFQLARAALMIGLMLIGMALAASLGRQVLLTGAFGLVIGYLVPTLVIRRLATKRQRRIKAELPDVLALLVVSLEAGVGLGEAIKLVGREAERRGRILGQELTTTAVQMAAGRTLEDSFRELGERTGVDEVKALVALAIQSDKVGARIASALRASADLLTSRRRLAAEEAAHKASVKILFPLIFLILPALLLITLGPAAIQIVRMFSSTR
jgi:tight adherence protein C